MEQEKGPRVCEYKAGEQPLLKERFTHYIFNFILSSFFLVLSVLLQKPFATKTLSFPINHNAYHSTSRPLGPRGSHGSHGRADRRLRRSRRPRC